MASDSSYRPQSPDLSSYVPQSPNLSGYRPQSPDLSAFPVSDTTTPQIQTQSIPPPYRHSLPTDYNRTHPTASSVCQPTSAPIRKPPPYDTHGYLPPEIVKAEDKDWHLESPPAKKSRLQPQKGGKAMAQNGATPQKSIKTEASDPTHGVTLKTSFPVARIKRIMQADEDIGKVAQVTPHVVSRALELFMIKLITTSAEQARGPGTAANAKGPRRVLAQHMKKAIQTDDTFDFLADIIAKVPDAPAAKSKKEAASDSDEVKPKKTGKRKKDSGDDF